MSHHISTLKPGDSLELMGPIGHFKYTSQQLQNKESIGMVAGGTGITPLFQILQFLLSVPDGKTKITLIYANWSYGDILLRTQLEGFARDHPDRFRLVYLLKQVPTIKQRRGEGEERGEERNGILENP
jgi:cytochrome-b5 reductase